MDTQSLEAELPMSDFGARLKPIGRILQLPGFTVWCCSPIYGPDGKVHVFFSRWPNEAGFRGWLSVCEVGHAVADRAEGPYEVLGVALQGSGGTNWDSWTVHNPAVYKVGHTYRLLYMATDGSGLGITQDELSRLSNEDYMRVHRQLLLTKRIGMAEADDLYGPWRRVGNSPLIGAGSYPSWDDIGTTNPALIITPEGKFRIYYKSFDRDGLDAYGGNRKYGFAEAEHIEGPYVKYAGNPIIDFTRYKPLVECEDAYIWREDGRYKAIMRDMGLINHTYGLYMESQDGIEWNNVQVAYREAPYYFSEPSLGLPREGRFERPQLLMKEGRPEFLFGAYRGGKYATASGVVLRV